MELTIYKPEELAEVKNVENMRAGLNEVRERLGNRSPEWNKSDDGMAAYDTETGEIFTLE